MKDFEAARGDAGTLATVSFDPGDGVRRTYSGVRVHRSGSERRGQAANAFGKQKSKDWDKRNFRFTFDEAPPAAAGGGAGRAAGGGPRPLFVWRTDLPPVKKINLHSMFEVRW